MENSVCIKCQKPLVKSEEINRRLCTECAERAESVDHAERTESVDHTERAEHAEPAGSGECTEPADRAEYAEAGGRESAESRNPVRPGIRPACGYHPDVEAVGICSRCGTFICDECWLDRTDPATGETDHYCRNCYGRIEEASYYCAWEDKSIFFYKRFWLTWREIIFHTHEFFDKLPRVPDKTSALTFSYLSFAHALFLSVIFFSVNPLYPFSSLPILMTGTVGLIGLTTLWLVAVPIVLFASATAIHLGIRLQFKRREFHQTFRIIGYASATQVLGAIPIVSGFIISALAGIINMVIVFSGLKRLQKLSTGQVILAVILVPSLIATALVILVGATAMMDMMNIW